MGFQVSLKEQRNGRGKRKGRGRRGRKGSEAG